jgi:hypothetical protein
MLALVTPQCGLAVDHVTGLHRVKMRQLGKFNACKRYLHNIMS